MTDIGWTENAAGDIKSIRDYIHHDSPTYARYVATRLYEAVGELRLFPESGRVVPERGDPALRELIRPQNFRNPQPPYRMVYRRHAAAVDILTIFHAARQFPQRLPGDAG